MNSGDHNLHIAIAFDQNYLNPFYALLTSVFEKNESNELSFHFIATGLSASELSGIKNYIKSKKAACTFYPVDEHFVKRFVVMNTWTPAVYYRLFFPFLLSENVKRFLYLDCDIIVLNDLKELFAQSIQPFPLGAVYDNYVVKRPELGIDIEENYFNSGVMLIDKEVWNQQKISEQAIAYLDKYPERIKFVDQDALNAVLINNWKKLDWKFNVLYSRLPLEAGKKELIHFLNDKIILHFTLQRPWYMLCRNRCRWLYFHYLKKTTLPIKNKYVDFSLKKLLPFLKIRVIELYFDTPLARSFWKKIKLIVAK